MTAIPASQADALLLLRAVVDALGESSSRPRWALVLFAEIDPDHVRMLRDGARIARTVRRTIGDAIQARTGVRTDRGLFTRSYRTTIAGMRRDLERAAPALAGAPIELFALLCWIDEKGTT